MKDSDVEDNWLLFVSLLRVQRWYFCGKAVLVGYRLWELGLCAKSRRYN